MNFLETLIDKSLNSLPADRLSDALFLFPSKRAILFFSHALQAHPKRPDPLLLPTLSTLSDWIVGLSGLQTASNETLLLTLFRCLRALSPDPGFAFDRFQLQGRTLLNDLIELDKGCLSPDEIKTLAAMSQSSDNPGSPLSTLLERLPALHHEFRLALRELGLTHYPLALTTLLEQKDRLQAAIEHHSAVFASGFYPIDRAEIELFSWLRTQSSVEILWDDDRYFVEQAGQETAWLFTHPKLFPVPKQIESDDLRQGNRTITLIETQGTLAQAKSIGTVLEQLQKERGHLHTDTALVLPDEALLLPLLSAVPASIEKINITMGYPLVRSLTASLLHAVEALHRQTSDPETIPFMPLYRLLTHPEWTTLTDASRLERVNEAQQKQSRAIDIDTARELIHPMEALLSPPRSPEALFDLILELIEQLRRANHGNAPQHKIELLYQMRRQILASRQMVSAPDIPMDIRTAWRILWDGLETGSLPFSGEPLEGLQVMGMLETRCLDFKNLIVLSFNEGRYPLGRSGSGFIPNEVKRSFGLAGYREYESLQAYHFYRLLKRSQRVWLLYDGSGREAGAEASRFIRQLELEFGQQCPNTRIIRQPIVQPPPLNQIRHIAIPNSETLRQRWRNHRFSASALNLFMSCPLRFFYRYGMKVDEGVENREEIDPRGLGLIAHHCLQNLYTPHIGQLIDSGVYATLLDRVETEVAQVSRERHPGLSLAVGRPYLEGEILIELLKRLIKTEMALPPFRLHAVELRLTQPIDLGGGVLYELTGSIDRIDELEDGRWRIVDYKSGQFERSDLNLSKMPLRFSPDDPFSKKGMAWQLLLYQWLFCRTKRHAPDRVSCAILSLRNPQEGFVFLPSSGDESARVNQFEALTADLLRQIDDLSHTFRSCDDPAVCARCPYRNICHR